MGMRLTIEDASRLDHDLWSAPLTPAEVRRLGDGQISVEARSVVAVARPDFDQAARTLSLDPNLITVLNVGSSDNVLFLEIASDAPSNKEIAGTVKRSEGDESFLTESKTLLGKPLVSIAERLLSEIRRHYPKELRRANQKYTWTNHPDNFVSFVIRPQKQCFEISVDVKPAECSSKYLNIKQGRPPYSRFVLEREDQFADAVRLILLSASKRTK